MYEVFGKENRWMKKWWYSAIFGLLGSLLYFGYYYRGYIGNQIIGQIIPVILINLVIGFISPGISNAAHIGGLIGGICISFMLGINDKSDKSNRITGTILTVVLTALTSNLANGQVKKSLLFPYSQRARA